MPEPRPRRATGADLDAVARLEAACFEPVRRSSRAVLRRSLQSPRQSVWVLEVDGEVVGSLVLWHHPRTVRVYGVAVHPDHAGQGLGAILMHRADREAQRQKAGRIVLEADADRPRLLKWYERQGYRRVRLRQDFYAPGRSAWRMEKALA